MKISIDRTVNWLSMTVFAAVVAVLLVGCDTTPPPDESAGAAPRTPAQTVFAAQTAYNGVVASALLYESLPRCEEGVEPVEPADLICSDPDIVSKIRKADNAAFASLEAAKAIVLEAEQSGLDPSALAVHADLALNAADAFKVLLVEFGLFQGS